MTSIRIKAQALNVAVDFEKKRLIGSTSLAVVLVLPDSYKSLLKTEPPSDVSLSSSISVPLRCPGPNICSLTSVEVNGVPAMFVHHPSSTLEEKHKENTGVFDLLTYSVSFHKKYHETCCSENLYIAIPSLALHRGAIKVLKSKEDTGLQNENAPRSEKHRSEISRSTLSIPLKILIGFTLVNLVPRNSVAYFTSYSLRSPGHLKVIHHDLFVARPDKFQVLIWFPTLPSCYKRPEPDQKKYSSSVIVSISCVYSEESRGRCFWTLQYTVPLGMTAIGPGTLLRRVKDKSSTFLNGPVETFFYETKGPLSPLPPEEICLFVGYFTLYSSPTSSHTVDSVLRTEDEKHKEDSEVKEPQISLWSLKGVNETMLIPSVETASYALKALRHVYGVNYPHSHLLIFFFPLGDSSLGLGEGFLNSSHSCLYTSLAHPGLDRSFLVYGSTVVMDLELLHTKYENHPLVYRSKEIIAEAVSSVLFGSVFSIPPHEMANDWWLLVAFRRLVVDSFIQETFGEPHLCALRWLKLELYAKLVETGYEMTPLSNAHLEHDPSPHNPDEKLTENHSTTAAGVSCYSSSFVSSSWFTPYDIVVGLKAGLIFPSLQVLFTSFTTTESWRSGVNEYDPSCSFWFPPVGTFQLFLSSLVVRAFKKGPGPFISTQEFLSRLERRLKTIFVSSGIWRHLSTEQNETLTDDTLQPSVHSSLAPTVETLDFSLYANVPYLDIGGFLQTVKGFFDSWVYGVGCSSSSISFFLQLPKKSAVMAIESCRMHFDETPLQPPTLIDPYTGVSDFYPALLACRPLLEQFIEEASDLDNQQDRQGLLLYYPNTPDTLSHHDLFANHDLSSLFLECHFELFPPVSSVELIVKDQGTGLGFGYVGRDTSPITDGLGTFYNFLETRLNSDWSLVDQDKRVLLTSDTSSRSALLYSQSEGRTLPVSLPPQAPCWLSSAAAAVIIRNVVRHLTVLFSSPAFRSGILSLRSFLDAKSRLLTEKKESVDKLPRLYTPLSLGFGKYYTDVLTVHTCREHEIVQDFYFFNHKELPTTFELRAFDDVKIFTGVAKPNQTHRFSREKIQQNMGNLRAEMPYSKEGLSRQFSGRLSYADGLFLSTNTVLHSLDILTLFESLSVDGNKLRPKDGAMGMRLVRKEKNKRLPILWIRVMSNTRPIWLSRFTRYQSIGMWEQQLLNDPFITSQLEASVALGKIPFSASVVSCLCWALRQHHLHPLVRSFVAHSLRRLHNENPKSHASHCLSVLLNYLYLYHYRSKNEEATGKKRLIQSRDEKTCEIKSGGVTLKPPKGSMTNGTGTSKDDPEVLCYASRDPPPSSCKSDKFFQLFPTNVPFWLTSEMIFLKDLLTAIAQLRDPDGHTTYEAIDTLTQLLMHHATDIPKAERINADYYIAHLISTLKYVYLPFQGCGAAVEDVSNPELCKLLTSFKGPQADAFKLVQDTWLRWREDEMDSYTESLFLHVWRYYRLDHCLHSCHHVMTCACLDVFSRNPILRDLLRLKLCDEAHQDFQLLSFLPLVFLPLIGQAFKWVGLKIPQEQAETLDFSNCSSFSNSVLIRCQLNLMHQFQESQDNHSLPSLMLSGLMEMVQAIHRNYYHYQDQHVERAALKALLYCTAVGSLQPPLILTAKYAALPLCSIQSVEDLTSTLQHTCFTELPSSVLHSQAMLLVASQWITEGSLSSSFRSLNTQPLTTFAEHHEAFTTRAQTDWSSLQCVSRYLFCSRWTSTEESDGLQRCGLSLLNAVILACRLDEVLLGCDATSLLGSVWDVFNEVLEDVLHDVPLVFSSYCIKPCRGLDEDRHFHTELESCSTPSILPPFVPTQPSDETKPDVSHVKRQTHWMQHLLHTSASRAALHGKNHFPTSSSPTSNAENKQLSFTRSPVSQRHLDKALPPQTSSEEFEGHDWGSEWMTHSSQDISAQRGEVRESGPLRRLVSPSSLDGDTLQGDNVWASAESGADPSELHIDDQFVDLHQLIDDSFSPNYFSQDGDDVREMELCDSLFVETGPVVDTPSLLKLPSEDLWEDNILDDVQQLNNEIQTIPTVETRPPQDTLGDESNTWSSLPTFQTSPCVLCVKILMEYLHTRVLDYPLLVARRMAGVKKVFNFLFGFGLPQCIALSHEPFLTPDPFYVDTFTGCLKHGRYLKKLCLFQKRYLEDDSPEVPDWQTLALDIIEVLISMPLATPFLDEVDHKEAPSYRLVVKQPMWLRRIQKKLQSQAYGSYQDWKSDLFLIFRNCRTFNFPESKIVQDCESLQTVVYSLLKLTEKLISRSSTTNPPP